jgi:hypothetical protein
MRKMLLPVLIGVLVSLAGASDQGWATVKGGRGSGVTKRGRVKLAPAALARPNTENKWHSVGNMWLTVSNWGFFGNQGSGGLGWDDYPYSCQFPARSGVDYLFAGGLWIGSLREQGHEVTPSGDSLIMISEGMDGWAGFPAGSGRHNFLYPGDDPADHRNQLVERSTRPNSDYYDTLAVSEQDFIGIYSDTVTNPLYVGPGWTPQYIEVEQRSYSWSYSYAQDFIVFDFDLINIGQDTLYDVFMGLYIDSDCGPSGPEHEGDKSQDDVCGFRRWRDVNDTLWEAGEGVTFFSSTGLPLTGTPKYQDPAEYIRTAWIGNANYDGDLLNRDPVYPGRSVKWPVPSVTGVRVLRTPNPNLKVNFNWWFPANVESLSWGPETFGLGQGIRGDTISDPYGPGGLDVGCPHYGNADRDSTASALYRVMRIGTLADTTRYPDGWFDPDQLDAYALDSLRPGDSKYARWQDTRYLFSFGPVYTAARESLGQYYMAPGDRVPITVAYVGGENFHLNKAPGTAGIPTPAAVQNGYAGFYDFADFALNSSWTYKVYDNPGRDTDADGDSGVFVWRVAGTDSQKVWLLGDGVPDFEGPPPPYGPNLKAIPSNGKVTLIWDNFAELPALNKDSWTGGIHSFEGYRVYRGYASATLQVAGYTLLAQFDWPDTAIVDTLRPNPQNPDSFVLDTLVTVQTGFNILPPPISEDLKTRYTDFDYRYMYVDSLLPNGFPQWYAVTAFDFGWPPTGLDPLECSQSVNLVRVIPAASYAEAGGKVMVVPNPYKVNYRTGLTGRISYYNEIHWERTDRLSTSWTEYDRRLDFINLPEECTIRIYTLGGDLVQTIEHRPPYDRDDSSWYSEPWDLLSRDRQAVAAGLYLFSIEKGGEVDQVGKFVIIK